MADRHGNVAAKEGCDRCDCGAKYWENDRCVSCGEPFRPPVHLQTGSSKVRCGAPMRVNSADERPGTWDLGTVTVDASRVTCSDCLEA